MNRTREPHGDAYDIDRLERGFGDWLECVRFRAEVDSTNAWAKREALSDGDDRARGNRLYLADAQSAGRGRLGRTWCADAGDAILMSLLAWPGLPAARCTGFVFAAALAACHAVEAATGHEARIKWPNDVLLAGRKVCGILVEVGTRGGETYAVIGVGINAHQAAFPAEIADRATSMDLIGGRTSSRQAVVEAFFSRFQEETHRILRGEEAAMLSDVSARLANLGKWVRASWRGETVEGKAMGLTREGALVLRLENGDERAIQAGEATIRGRNGYV